MRFPGPLLLFAIAPCCLAQYWDVGIAGGYGFYHNPTIKTPLGSAEAGVENGWAAGAVLTEDVTEHFGGELRYTYRAGDLTLSSSGTKANLNADTHTVNYDLLIYGTPRRARVRPFAAVGGGIKNYIGTGVENMVQPLSNFALLTHASQIEGLVSVGGGVKFMMAHRLVLRFDFRDYMTPFPDRLFGRVPNATQHGWLHDFVPLVGVDWVLRDAR